MRNEISVLHVDDDPSASDLTATFLERENDQFSVQTATNANDGLDIISDRPPDCVVSDYNMPGMDGIEFLQAVREEYPDFPFILYTGKGSEAVASDALSAGATDYIQKQSGSEQYELLANRIDNAVERYRSQKRLRETRKEYTTIFKNAQNALLLIDVEDGGFRYRQCNPRAIELIGRDRTEVVGERPREALGPENGRKVVGAYRKCIQQREPVAYTVTLDLPVGRVIRDCEVTPVSSDGEIEKLVAEFRDITEQRQRQRDLERTARQRNERERELREEQRFIEQALDTLDDLFYVFDTDGTFRRWNSRLPELTSYTDDDLAGMQAVKLFPEDERENIADGIATTLADGQAKVEADLRTAGGERLPCEFTGAQLTDEDGTVTGLVGVGRDLTERRQRERELERQNDLFAKTQDIADVGAWAHNTESRTLTWTDHVYEMHGVSKEFDPSLEEVVQLYHPDDRPKLRKAHDQAVTAGKPYDLEVRMTAKDDGIRWIRTVADPQTENGEVVRVRGAVHDITDQKQREQEIRNLKRQYQTLLENFPNGAVYLIDKDLKYMRARGTELRRVGLSPANIEGKTPHDLFPEQIADEACHYYEQALEGTASTFEQEYQGQRYRIQTVPVRYDGEEVTHLMAVAQNITEYAEDKRELERKNKRLEEFASIVSHDLRSPIGVAEGHLELAAETCESDHLARATDAIDRSQALIDDLLALAREGDRVDETERIKLAKAAESSLQTVETRQATLDADASQVIEADRSRLQQLFENLYRNAVEHGGDDVTVSVGAIDDGFYVADSGPGIPESDREDVFEAGYSTNEDGTGFGLRIVEQVANAHGWEVAITESEEGGARFEITGVEKGA